MLLSNLKLVATLQYKPEGSHVLFYISLVSQTQPTPAWIAFSIKYGEGSDDVRYVFVCTWNALNTENQIGVI